MKQDTSNSKYKVVMDLKLKKQKSVDECLVISHTMTQHY